MFREAHEYYKASGLHEQAGKLREVLAMAAIESEIDVNEEIL